MPPDREELIRKRVGLNAFTFIVMVPLFLITWGIMLVQAVR